MGSATLLLALMAAAPPGDRSPNQWGYGFPPALDAEIAAPAVHRVHYEDDHIMLMEVANPPGYVMQTHGHPYPSIFARTSGATNIGGKNPTDTYLEPDGRRNGEHWHNAPAPAGGVFPLCTSADPQAPHRPVNRGAAPQHFYRIEFKRFGGPMPPVPERTLFEDAGVRLVEVSVAPGHASARPVTSSAAVLAFDEPTSFDALDRVLGGGAGRSLPPDGMTMPRCMTVAPGLMPIVTNHGRTPLHFYRLEFKRIEGDGLTDHWREWYPFMVDMLKTSSAP